MSVLHFYLVFLWHFHTKQLTLGPQGRLRSLYYQLWIHDVQISFTVIIVSCEREENAGRTSAMFCRLVGLFQGFSPFGNHVNKHLSHLVCPLSFVTSACFENWSSFVLNPVGLKYMSGSVWGRVSLCFWIWRCVSSMGLKRVFISTTRL